MSNDFYSKAHELWQQGVPFATAVVVRAEKPTSAKPGDRAVITPQGEIVGWIGGSCAQPTVLKEAQKALSDGQPRFIRLSNADPLKNPPRDGLIDMPMTCLSQGALEIYIEPQHPALRLMVIGSSPIAHKLIELGQVMDYQVIAVDPDAAGQPAPAHAHELLTDLEALAARVTPLTYIVVASHGNYDELALQHALKTNAAYVALVASKTRAEAAMDYLKHQGLSAEEVARLKVPAGLDIGARQGEEIALSIIAEIVQRRREPKSIDVASLLDEVISAAPAPAKTAIDPICGMSVEVDKAKYKSDYNGETIYFCAPGCKMLFDEDPAKYVEAAPPSGKAIDPVCGMEIDITTAEHMAEHDGKLYYFCCVGCKTAFERSPAFYIAEMKSGG